MKQRSFKINEQGSHGEEVSHEEQHQADIESKNMAAKQHNKQQNTHYIQVAEEQRVHDNGVEMRTTKEDGDEDSLEGTGASAQKATESRNEVHSRSVKGHFPRRARSHKQHEARNQKRRER